MVRSFFNSANLGLFFFKIQLTVNGLVGNIKFAGFEPWTSGVGPLYQLSHNHCPAW